MIKVEGACNSRKKNNFKFTEDDDFISPFLKDEIVDEIVTVHPKEPTKKSKVYVIKDETGLTGRNYVYCSGCQHRAFKQFRNANRSTAPQHLKKHYDSTTELLKFCRNCWFETHSALPEKQEHPAIAPSPYFEKSSLGVTDRRACFGWHFIQRDLVQQRLGKVQKSSDRKISKTSSQNTDHEDILLPLATVVVKSGSDYIIKQDGGNLFDSNGREASFSSRIESEEDNDIEITTTTVSAERQKEIRIEKKRSETVKQIRRDHSYAPSVQKEVEVASSSSGYEKMTVSMTKNNSNSQVQSRKNSRTNSHKLSQNSQNVKNATKNFVKNAAEMGSNAGPNLAMRLDMPIDKVEEEVKLKREKDGSLDPTYLVGLKGSSDSGKALPGLICPLCGKHTIKSYSVWRKDNAPPQISNMFKDGISIIRACRKCVPYPINREKEKAKRTKHNSKKIKDNHKGNKKISNRKQDTAKSSCKATNKEVTRKRQFDNTEDNKTVKVKVERVKDNVNGLSHGKGRNSVKGETKGDMIHVRVEVVKGPKNGLSEGDVLNGVEESAAKRVKIEEKKRKLQLASGQDLTGLECFEMLPSEDNMTRVSNLRRRDGENASGSTSVPLRGRPPKANASFPGCSKCHNALDKSFKTLTIAKCPKRLLHLFENGSSSKTLKLCTKCLK